MTSVTPVEPAEGATLLHVGVVAAEWNPTITDALVEGAIERLRQLGVGKVTLLRVPGSLELGLGARALAGLGCDAVVALGAVVKGDTDHYSVVVTESARALTLVALEAGIPVTNGILAVHDIVDAIERSRAGPANKGDEAAAAAVVTALKLRTLAEWTNPEDLVS